MSVLVLHRKAARLLSVLGLLLLPIFASAETEVINKSGPCITRDAYWSVTEHWTTGPDGQKELACSMGVSCNGRAWNTCGRVMGGGGADYDGLPVRPYNDAVNGDTIRMRLGDDVNHVTGLSVAPGRIQVTTDRDAVYRVFSLTTGALIVENLATVPAGTQTVLSLPAGLGAGVYMVIAYDPALGISLGYRAFAVNM